MIRMTLSEDQIQRLMEWFANSSETKKRSSEHRKKALEENHKWVQPDIIQKISDEELETTFLDYYKSGGGRQTFNQIFRDRIIYGWPRNKGNIERFRNTILFCFLLVFFTNGEITSPPVSSFPHVWRGGDRRSVGQGV